MVEVSFNNLSSHLKAVFKARFLVNNIYNSGVNISHTEVRTLICWYYCKECEYDVVSSGTTSIRFAKSP
jgi:hypothetical protein